MGPPVSLLKSDRGEGEREDDLTRSSHNHPRSPGSCLSNPKGCLVGSFLDRLWSLCEKGLSSLDDPRCRGGETCDTRRPGTPNGPALTVGQNPVIFRHFLGVWRGLDRTVPTVPLRGQRGLHRRPGPSPLPSLSVSSVAPPTPTFQSRRTLVRAGIDPRLSGLKRGYGRRGSSVGVEVVREGEVEGKGDDEGDFPTRVSD